MYRTESEDDLRVLQRKKWVLLGIDTVLFLLMFCMIPVCFWIRFDLDFREWVREMDWYVYWNCMYVNLINFILVAGTCILQAYGVIQMVPTALGVSIILWIICWIFSWIGGVLIIVYGVEQSPVLTNSLDEVFWRLIYATNIDPRATRILTIIEEYTYCCGSNGSEDYIGAHKPVPWSCRSPISGNEYTSGCKQKFSWYLEPWTGAISATCALLIIVLIVQIVLLLRFIRHLKRYDRVDNDYDDQYNYKD